MDYTGRYGTRDSSLFRIVPRTVAIIRQLASEQGSIEGRKVEARMNSERVMRRYEADDSDVGASSAAAVAEQKKRNSKNKNKNKDRKLRQKAEKEAQVASGADARVQVMYFQISAQDTVKQARSRPGVLKSELLTRRNKREDRRGKGSYLPEAQDTMETSSPPLTPIRNYMSPIDTSPASSYREQLRRRTSSFSSNHSLSPVTPRSRHRFSNASQYSNEPPTPGDERSAGLGNLADELDQLDDDDEEYEEDTTEASVDALREPESKEPRDSGVDVTYRSRTNSPRTRNFSKPFGTGGKPPDEDDEDKLSPELEDAMTSIAHMTSSTSISDIPRIMALLQDLGNQATLEAGTQRLTTSTNSLATHLTAQSRNLQALATSLYSPFTSSAPLDPDLVAEATPLVDALLKDLPLGTDTSALQGMQKLDRETTNVIQTLSQLTDTIQMGKQITNSAARHLRTTQTMVADLRREHERADLARHELAKANVAQRLKARTCAAECRDVLAGFEDFCDALRECLQDDVGAV
ncbi:hypothetical protein LTR08_008305 [Meristemomyces frigidus]|nr:hypothetical protein LTR08_008305 [Meristemomyces frigidus]